MSKFLSVKNQLGYKGEKKNGGKGSCNLIWCNNPRTKYKGEGHSLCEEHQAKMREYGGTGRLDRPWTFNKKHTCERCGYDPMTHHDVKSIKDELVKFRFAMRLLVVDHITPQRDGGTDAPDNVQTLCLHCNEMKTAFYGDTTPRALYKDIAEFEEVQAKLEKTRKDANYH